MQWDILPVFPVPLWWFPLGSWEEAGALLLRFWCVKTQRAFIAARPARHGKEVERAQTSGEHPDTRGAARGIRQPTLHLEWKSEEYSLDAGAKQIRFLYSFLITLISHAKSK